MLLYNVEVNADNVYNIIIIMSINNNDLHTYKQRMTSEHPKSINRVIMGTHIVISIGVKINSSIHRTYSLLSGAEHQQK